MATIKNAIDVILQNVSPRVISQFDTTNLWLIDFLSDGVISLPELQTIRGYWDSITSNKTANDTLASSVLFSLTTEKNAYDNAYIAIGSFLNGVTWTSGVPYYISDTYIKTYTNIGLSIDANTGTTFRNLVKNFETALTTLTLAFSNSAKTVATNVNDWVNTTLSDNFLSIIELQGIRSGWDFTIAEQTSINTQVTSYSLTSLGNTYTAAIVALGFFLNGNLAWTVGTIPTYISDSFIKTATVSTTGYTIGATTGADFRTKVKDFEVARTAIFNAVSNLVATATGTTNYNMPGVPSNSAIPPIALSPTLIQYTSTPVTSTGLINLTVTWTYTQGTLPADTFIIYVSIGTATPTAASISISVKGDVRSYTWFGVAADQSFVAGIAPSRTSVSGVQTGAITSSALWTRTGGTVNITANVGGATSTVIATTVGASNITSAVASPNTSILNSGITLNAAGVLSGAGGGSVTAAGIGAATSSDLANKLTNGVANVLSSGTALKTANYDSVAAGAGGLVVTDGGITARKRNSANTGWDNTFAIGSDGTATFSGLITGANGQFTKPLVYPAFHAAYSLSVVGNGGNVGVVGEGSLLGVVGLASISSSWGVSGQNLLGGVAVNVEGKMQISNSTQVYNLNASYLGGKSLAELQLALGYTPIQQGGGIGQSWNKVYIGWTGAGLKLTVDSTDLGYIYTSNSPSSPTVCYRIGTNSGDATANASGYINFLTGGSLTAAYRFIGSGSTATITDVSDKRLKKDITPETLGLDFINKLEPVKYKMRADDTLLHHGFIAQDMQKHFPTSNIDSLLTEAEDGYLGVGYTALISILTKSVQELSQELNNLKQQLGK